MLTLTAKRTPDVIITVDLALTRNGVADAVIGLPSLTRHGADRYKVDSIPFYASDVHLFDIVEVEHDFGMPEITKVVEPSGYATLRIGAHQTGLYVVNAAISFETTWANHPIRREMSRLGLIAEHWIVGEEIRGAVFGVPPSYNRNMITLLQSRHPDLCIELF